MRTKRFYFLILLLPVTWFACTKVDINFGDQYLDNGYTQVVRIDSFAADVSTVYVDSFITSAKGVSMIGNYNDPVFGKIVTNNYFEVVPPAYIERTDYIDSLHNITFDSLALVLHPDGSYLGDTTKAIHVSVNRLAQAIVPYDNSLFNLYNTNSFAVQSAAIGSRDIIVRPNAKDSFTIRLSDAFGKELLTKFQDVNDGDVRSNDAFLQYLFGFRLSAAANSQLIFGCKDSATMRLYYKKPGVFLENRTVDFTLANNAHHFNNITVDRSATVLKDLGTLKQINSTATNNTAYTMYAAGAMIKIRFPSARDVLRLPNFAKILKATLVIRPVRGTYGSNYYTLPPSLRLTSTTQLNLIGNDLAFTSNGVTSIQTGDLFVDNLYGESTSYAYDVTSYLKSIVTDGSINQNGLLLIPPSPALETQFGRVIVGNHNNTDGKMELLIVYAAIQ